MVFWFCAISCSHIFNLIVLLVVSKECLIQNVDYCNSCFMKYLKDLLFKIVYSYSLCNSVQQLVFLFYSLFLVFLLVIFL